MLEEFWDCNIAMAFDRIASYEIVAVKFLQQYFHIEVVVRENFGFDSLWSVLHTSFAIRVIPESDEEQTGHW